MPRSIYKAIRTPLDPWLICIGGEGTFKDSSQITAYKFCSECEKQLNKQGELWVHSQVRKGDGTFPLLNSLLSAKPRYQSNTRKFDLYDGSSISTIDVASLSYFAFSIFWRASLPWGTSYLSIELGPYKEIIRQYLLGKQLQSENMFLSATIFRGAAANFPAMMFPVTAKDRAGVYHDFHIPGIRFRLFIRRRLIDGEKLKHFCLLRSGALLCTDDHELVTSPFIDADLIAKAADKAKGRTEKNKRKIAEY